VRWLEFRVLKLLLSRCLRTTFAVVFANGGWPRVGDLGRDRMLHVRDWTLVRAAAGLKLPGAAPNCQAGRPATTAAITSDLCWNVPDNR